MQLWCGHLEKKINNKKKAGKLQRVAITMILDYKAGLHDLGLPTLQERQGKFVVEEWWKEKMMWPEWMQKLLASLKNH